MSRHWGTALNGIANVVEQEKWPCSAQVIREAADEIERLLDKIADLSCQVSNGEAEIERLEKEVNLQCELKHAACDREDRLLAALERIKGYTKGNLDQIPYEIAREALDGE